MYIIEEKKERMKKKKNNSVTPTNKITVLFGKLLDRTFPCYGSPPPTPES